MVGNVGCGKSTLTKEYAEKGHKVFNGDAITMMIGAGIYKYHVQDIPLIAKMRELFIYHCLSNGFSFVIDSTNMSLKQRSRIILMVKQRPCFTTTIIDFGPGTEGALQRRIDQSGNCEKWDKVYEALKSQYQRPEETEANVVIRRSTI